MPTSTLMSATSAAAEPIRACGPPSTKPPTRRGSKGGEAMSNHKTSVSRRQFVIAAAAFGGGLAIGVLPRSGKAAFVNVQPWGLPTDKAASEFTPWISITPDDVVTVRVPTPDIGNGVMTQV